jgi:1-deoxy-D-xylulose 5-phosphate reductoisomerase
MDDNPNMNVEATKKKLSPDEQIAKLSKRIEQLKKQKQAIANREKEIQRKTRTRRLIENGAIAEKYLNCEGIKPSDFEAVVKKIVGLAGVREIIKGDYKSLLR